MKNNLYLRYEPALWVKLSAIIILVANIFFLDDLLVLSSLLAAVFALNLLRKRRGYSNFAKPSILYILCFSFLAFYYLNSFDLYVSVFLTLRLALIIYIAMMIGFSIKIEEFYYSLQNLARINFLRNKLNNLKIILFVSYRFLPDLLSEGRRIFEAQQLRGVNFRSANILVVPKLYLSLVIPILVSSLNKAKEISYVIQSRELLTCGGCNVSIRNRAADMIYIFVLVAISLINYTNFIV